MFQAYHGLKCDVAVLFEGGFALLLRGRPVIRDISHVALFLVAVVAFDGTVIYGFLDLEK
jgi:hypothetical protein